MRFYLLAFAALLFGASSCKDTNATDPEPITTGELEINFKALVNNQTLVTYAEDYQYTDGNTLTIQILEFYISDLELLKADGGAVSIADYSYVNFNGNQGDPNTAEQGEDLRFDSIPPGEYTGIRYNVGLTAEQNAMEPGDFPATSMLSVTANYWTAWQSYIFSKIEGYIVLPDNSRSNFLYHSGADGMRQELEFNTPISISAGNRSTMGFEVHAERILTNGNTSIDPYTEPTSHSGDVGTPEYKLAERSAINLAAAIELRD